MNLANCSQLPAQTESGIWFRALQPQFLPTAISTTHTRALPSRFNAGQLAATPFEVLYLAENHLVALFEVQALLGTPSPGGLVPHPRRAWTLINITVNLANVINLADPQTQRQLNASAQELTGDWRGYQLRGPQTSVIGPNGTAPTQDLGLALYQTPNLEGFITLSAKLPDQKVLVVFPQKLQSPKSIHFWDPTTGQSHHLP